MSAKIEWVGNKICSDFDAPQAEAALIACGFLAGDAEHAEILASYDNAGSVIDVVVRAASGWYAGNNSDGWNTVNSLQEVLGTTAPEIDDQFGEFASETALWQAFLNRQP
jgi:hypothetical protein